MSNKKTTFFENIGTVKKSFFNDRGFGFLLPDNPSETDVFVSVQELVKANICNLNIGDRVGYTTRIGRNGQPQAINLRKLEAAT